MRSCWMSAYGRSSATPTAWISAVPPKPSASAAPITGWSGVSTGFASVRRRHASHAARGSAMWKATERSAFGAIG